MEYSIKPKRLGERRIIHYPQKRIIGLYVRKILSESSYLPEIFKYNFKLERVLAEIVYQDYLKERGKIVIEEYLNKIENLSREIEEIKKSPAADVSLFESLEHKPYDCKMMYPRETKTN